MKSKTTILLILILCAAMSAIAQTSAEEKQSARRDGVITGRVVTADGQPISDARLIAVGVSAKLGEMNQTACDEAGNFKLTGLRAGAYRILATMPGYVSLNDGSDTELYRVGAHATITMVKGGVITGRVTDAAGEPMAAVRVVPKLLRDSSGQRASSAPMVTDAGQAGRLTDDRGIYRLYGLQPGTYVVSVNGSPLPEIGMGAYPRDSATYHPSAPRDTAVEIIIRDGAEAIGIDIRHRGERGHTISGTLSGETESDALVNAVSVMLKSATTGELHTMNTVMGSRAFALANVADGEYELLAVRVNESFDFAASQPRRVSVKGADVAGIELKLLKLGAISGRVLIEKAKPADACANKENFTQEEISLSADRETQKSMLDSSLFALMFGANSTSSLPNDKGEFTLKNLEAGGYHLTADLPGENWFLRSMTLPPVGAAKTKTDAARSPINVKSGEKVSNLEITIAEGAAAVSGKVIAANESQKLHARLRIHLIPSEPTAAEDVLRYREVVSSDGLFSFKHLSPGKYRLLVRSESGQQTQGPIAYDNVERARLRREAESANTELALSPCQQAKDVVVKYALKQ